MISPKLVASLLLVVGCLTTSYAQRCASLFQEVSLEERYGYSTSVVEGRVNSRQSYWDEDRSSIYTVYEVVVYQQLKGSAQRTAYLAFLGGTIGNQHQTASTSPKLNVGEEGIFFLESATATLPGAPPLYTTVGAKQGLVKYHARGGGGHDLFNTYTSVQRDVLDRLAAIANQGWQRVQPRPARQTARGQGITPLAAPTISGFSPTSTTAGTGTTLTITGTDFGSTAGTVFFPDADDGGISSVAAHASEVLSWTNTQIEVLIPYRAGTGPFQVDNGSETALSGTDLSVTYNYKNVENGGLMYSAAMAAQNTEGGITFLYHSDFNTSPAKPVFEDAFEKWNCETDINFTLGGNTSADVSSRDRQSIVRFDNGNELPVGVLGQIRTYYSFCGISTQARTQEMDILWDDATNWYYGSATPAATEVDFKSIALHELGHAHQLGHVIDPGSVMHFSLGVGESNYSLSVDDIAGAQRGVSESLASDVCGATAMTAATRCCDDTAIDQNPTDASILPGQTASFTVAEHLVDAYRWQMNAGGGWTNLAEDATYIGTQTSSLTVNSAAATMNGHRFRCQLSRSCGDQLLTTAATLTVTAGGVTAILDANFERFLVDEGIDTNGLNGNILNADAQAVTDLDVTRNDITDFTGLEAFVNVVSVDLGRNRFPTLPLSTLTALEELVFDRNDVLASIDFSGNPNLRILSMRSTGFGGSGPITSINLENNLLLEEFTEYAYRAITEIKLPQSGNLKVISMSARGVDPIDLANQSGLEHLTLGQTNTGATVTLPNEKTVLKSITTLNRPISSIALDGFINLESIRLLGSEVANLSLPISTSLKTINIATHNLPAVFSLANASQLESLSITGNRLLTPFEVDIRSNPMLDDLNLEGNKMVRLDISQNPLLIEVDVSNNELTTLNTSQNPLLESLKASRNKITALDLSQNTVLRKINLNTNELPTLDLAANIALEQVNLGTNQLPGLDITTNTLIHSLFIGNNLFTGTGLDLTQNAELSSLYAENNQISSLDITQNLKLLIIILNYNLFPGTAILDQFYSIRADNDGIRSGRLEVSHNLLTGTIPDFRDLMHFGPDDGNWTRNFELTIDNNYFEFGDLEAQHLNTVALLTTLGDLDDPVMRQYSYAPQAKVDVIETLTPNGGEDITLTTTVRGAQNHYRWFKDGVAIPGAPDSPEYTITNVNSCDNGVYHSEIRSDLMPFENGDPPGTNGKNLLLVRNDITLAVNDTPICSALTLPLGGATNVPINTGVTWGYVPGACSYTLSVGTTAGGTDIVDGLDVGETLTHNFAADLPVDTEIFVSVVPNFQSGPATGCSAESFTTTNTATLSECVSLSTPEDGATDVAVDAAITWPHSNGADGYFLSVGTSAGGTDLGNMTDVGNANTYSFSPDLPGGTTVYVTVTPYNDQGSATGCAEVSFTTLEAAPLLPTCATWASPAPGATGVPVSTDLAWTAANEAEGYRLTAGTTSGGTDILNAQDVGDVTTYDLTNDLPEGTAIYVTIVPYNAQGSATGCSEVSFTTETSLPDCTALSSPTGGAEGVAIDVDFSWNSAIRATGYRLTVGTTAGGADILDREDAGDVTTYDLPNDLPAGSDIFVTVIPYNAGGNAGGCTEVRFTTETLPPPCTVLASPADGAEDVATDTNMSWLPAAGATGYQLSVGTAAGNTDILSGEDVGDITTYNLPSDLPEGNQIFVTITPYNAGGSAENCREVFFTTTPSATPTLLMCTALSQPADGATEVTVDADLMWPAVAEATGYRLTMGTTPGGAEILDNQDVGDITTYSLAADLPESSLIYVSVVPYNAEGSATACSEISFTTAATTAEPEPTLAPPACVTLTSPAPAATDVAVTSELVWSPSPGASGYRLTVGTTVGAADIVNRRDVGNMTTYTLPSNLPENTQVFVSIVPYDSASEAMACEGQHFFTEALVVAAQEDETRYGFSPDGDGINEFWVIDGIEETQGNTVSVYNRWGDLVFEIDNYDNASRVFQGEANRLRGLGASKLPEGTYFFRIAPTGAHSLKKLTGFLVLKR